MTTPLAAALDLAAIRALARIREGGVGGDVGEVVRSAVHRAAELGARDALDRAIEAIWLNHANQCADCQMHAVKTVRALLPTAGEFLRSELGGGEAKEKP